MLNVTSLKERWKGNILPIKVLLSHKEKQTTPNGYVLCDSER